jgi:ribosomal protein L1
VLAVGAAKPSGARGQFLLGAHISSTQGMGIKIDIRTPPFNRLTKL